eukprot:358198-Chlamydomonas_euryale.AAC.7
MSLLSLLRLALRLWCLALPAGACAVFWRRWRCLRSGALKYWQLDHLSQHQSTVWDGHAAHENATGPDLGIQEALRQIWKGRGEGEGGAKGM